MRKLLIVANLQDSFPRITNIAYHLSEYGWQPYLLSVTPPEDAAARFSLPPDFFEKVRLIPVPADGDIFSVYRPLLYKLGLKRGRSFSDQIKTTTAPGVGGVLDWCLQMYQAAMGFPDTQRQWIKPALAAAAKIKMEEFDIILSSHPHASVNVVASKLSEISGVPWVADFRDLWSQNHNYKMPSWRKRLDCWYEKITLANSTRITTVSPGFARTQERFIGRPLQVITNGFGRDTLAPLPGLPAPGFTITYCGTLYPGVQAHLKFFRPLAGLVASGKISLADLSVRFIGTERFLVEKAAAECGLEGVVKVLPRLPRKELFEKQRESQVLLMFNWEDPGAPGVYALKLFEYLAARRPILATGGYPGDDVAGIISASKGGIFAVTQREVEDALLKMYSEYKSGGRVGYYGKIDVITRYSYNKLAGEFAELFEEVLRERKAL